MALLNPELITQANSKEVLRQFTPVASNNSTIPKPSFHQIMELINDDTLAAGAVEHFVDRCMEGDWAVIKKNSRSYDREFEDKLMFDHNFEEQILRIAYLQLKLFKNAYIEIVTDSKEGLKDLNMLDPLNIEVITKSNGDIIKFVSNIPDPITGDYPEWTPEQIIWLKGNPRDNGYGMPNIQALWRNLRIKFHVQRFIDWCFETGQYRVLHNFKSSGDKVVNDFIAYNKKNENNYRAPFLYQGEYETTLLRDMREIENVHDYLKYLDSQTLSLLRISPIDGGVLDNSGRSSSDTQTSTTLTHIKSNKKIISNGMNRLFKLINKGNNIFVFSPSDRFEMNSILENAQMMKSAQFTDEVIKEYLTDNGVVFRTNKYFNEVIDPSISNPRDIDNSPSRQGKKTGEANSKVGTGSQSTTRQDQLVKQATDKKYWYYTPIDPEEQLS